MRPLLLLLLVAAAAGTAATGWGASTPDPTVPPATVAPAATGTAPTATDAGAGPSPRRPISSTEKLGVMILCSFLVQAYVGRAKNRRLTAAIGRTLSDHLRATQFAATGLPARPDGGAAPLLTRESGHEATLWATGRRNVSVGALFTIKLVPRQDALSLAYALFDGEPDVIEVAVPLAEGGPPIALAVGRKRALDVLIDTDHALHALARPRPAPRSGAWPPVLALAADNEAALKDLILAGPLARTLARTGPILRTLRVVPDGALGSPRSLSAVIDVPPSGDAAALAPALAVVNALLATVDAVAAYKLAPAAKAEAEAAREKAAKAKDGGGGGGGGWFGGGDADAAEARRAAKRDAERERLRRMTPAEREKYLAKKERVEARRNMKRMTIRG